MEGKHAEAELPEDGHVIDRHIKGPVSLAILQKSRLQFWGPFFKSRLSAASAFFASFSLLLILIADLATLTSFILIVFVSSVALTCMNGTLKLFDGMAPSWNILEVSGIHSTVSIINKLILIIKVISLL